MYIIWMCLCLHVFVWCVGPPSVEVFPGAAVTVDLNENLTLDCRASGRPEPTVTWSRSVSCVVFVCYFVHGKGAKYCNLRVSMSVFLLAYLKKQQTKLHEIVCTLYMLCVAVSRSSCDDCAYVVYYRFCR